MALALPRERFVCNLLQMVAGAVPADPEPVPPRLVRGCIALACTACVLAVACSRRLADAVKGGQLSYMVLSDAEPILAGLVRGCIALAITACVLAVACSHPPC